MHRLPVRCLSVLFLLSAPMLLSAQEGRLTLSAFAGPSFLSLTQVEEDGRKDIAIYNQRDIPIGDYDPLDYGMSFEGQAEYRFDRDLSMNVFLLYSRAPTSAAFADSAQTLSLDRLITSTDVGIDLRYYLPPLVYGSEASFFLGLGRMVGHAEQTTGQSHREKSADTTISVVDQEAFAEYEKKKLYVRIGGQFSLPVYHHIRLSLQALYKFAPLGTMDGTLREFSLVRPHTTTIEFDFTTIDVKLGLSYVIE